MQAGVYKHYKGGYYQVLGVGTHTETNENFVVYVSLTGGHATGPRIRLRPLEMWNSLAELANGSKIDRFVYIGDEIHPAEKVAQER